MTTPTRAGWYDDPQDDAKLRYFDGVVWTNHTTPRSTRPAAVAPQQGQQQYPGEGHPPQYPGQSAQAPGQQPPQPHAPYQQSPYQAPYQQPPYQQAPNPQFPGAPQQGGWSAPAHPGFATGPTTPDGQPLAGYWQRVGAFLIDWVAQLVLGLVFGGYFLLRGMSGYFDQIDGMVRDVEAGGQPDLGAVLDSIDRGQLAIYSVVAILVFVVYQLFFLSRYGQTPGKMACNISVRLRDRPGVPPMNAVVRRVGAAAVLFVLQLVPVLGSLAQLARLLDLLWPAWDGKKQALHDKVAETNVVVGKPIRRQP
jgi:uncharacterized RDD family membrane protein YckC